MTFLVIVETGDITQGIASPTKSADNIGALTLVAEVEPKLF